MMIGIVAFLGSTIGRLLLGAAGGIFLLGGAYIKGNNHGHRTEKVKWEHAVVLEKQRQAKVIEEVKSDAAKELEIEKAESGVLQKQVDDYAIELQKRPAAAQCVLDKHDADRLRSIK